MTIGENAADGALIQAYRAWRTFNYREEEITGESHEQHLPGVDLTQYVDTTSAKYQALTFRKLTASRCSSCPSLVR